MANNNRCTEVPETNKGPTRAPDEAAKEIDKYLAIIKESREKINCLEIENARLKEKIESIAQEKQQITNLQAENMKLQQELAIIRLQSEKPPVPIQREYKQEKLLKEKIEKLKKQLEDTLTDRDDFKERLLTRMKKSIMVKYATGTQQTNDKVAKSKEQNHPPSHKLTKEKHHERKTCTDSPRAQYTGRYAPLLNVNLVSHEERQQH